ncbi:MAG: phosphate signaling complex protein PhoU [Calditrichia bacterium]
MWKDLLKLLKKGTLLDQSFEQSLAMFDILIEMLENGIQYLYDSNEIEEEKIYEMDKRINLLEQKVRRNIYNHLLLNPSESLYMSLVLTHLIIDLERVGDYIKNIIELRTLKGDKLNFHSYQEELHQIEEKVLNLIKETKQALANHDEKLAMEIQKKYYDIIRLCDQRDEEFVKADLDIPTSDVAALTLYYRYFKRIYSHLTNVASAIANPYDRIGFHPQDIL